jgi:uncharacterized protein (UPF0548 family)
MFFLSKPPAKTVESLLMERQAMSFSYPDVGATRRMPPPGWPTNHMRAPLGTGRRIFVKSVEALFSWRLLALDGLEVFPSSAPAEAERVVGILSRHLGIWSVDFCRVIYVLQGAREDNDLLRTGFAYGTLPGHALRGEELFSLEWHSRTEQVWYDIFSFSLPANPLVRLASPVARAAQKRFARASLDQAIRLARDA